MNISEENILTIPKTTEELELLESRPKTTIHKALDYLIVAAPLITGAAAIAEYLILPNFEDNVSGRSYLFFLSALLVLWGLGCLAALFDSKLFAKIRYKAPFFTFIFALLIIYDYLTLKTGRLMPPYFPWVDQILSSAITDRAYLAECAFNSLKLLFTGYFVGAASGIITGIACGYNKKINYWISPFLKLLGAIPSITWLPIVLVLAGTLFQGSVFIIALGVWFALTIAAMTGINNIDKSYYEAARTLGASNIQLITRIALPCALPNIFQGLLQGMSSACTALLIAEMIGVESGLGWYITWQKSWAHFAQMYAAITLICVIFVAVNFVLGLIKNRVLAWQQGIVRD